MASKTAQSIFIRTSVSFAKYLCIFQYKQSTEAAVILVWKLWTVYPPLLAATAILSCVIKIRGLFKSTKWRHLKMSNLKISRPGVYRAQKVAMIIHQRHHLKDKRLLDFNFIAVSLLACTHSPTKVLRG